MMFCSTLQTTMGVCTRILAMRATRGKKKTAADLERKSCWEGGVGDPESIAPLNQRMTSREKKEIKRWMKTEASG
jgi:hypothetical protein